MEVIGHPVQRQDGGKVEQRQRKQSQKALLDEVDVDGDAGDDAHHRRGEVQGEPGEEAY